jgi:hypothetical protein
MQIFSFLNDAINGSTFRLVCSERMDYMANTGFVVHQMSL